MCVSLSSWVSSAVFAFFWPEPFRKTPPLPPVTRVTLVTLGSVTEGAGALPGALQVGGRLAARQRATRSRRRRRRRSSGFSAADWNGSGDPAGLGVDPVHRVELLSAAFALHWSVGEPGGAEPEERDMIEEPTPESLHGATPATSDSSPARAYGGKGSEMVQRTKSLKWARVASQRRGTGLTWRAGEWPCRSRAQWRRLWTSGGGGGSRWGGRCGRRRARRSCGR